MIISLSVLGVVIGIDPVIGAFLSSFISNELIITGSIFSALLIPFLSNSTGFTVGFSGLLIRAFSFFRSVDLLILLISTSSTLFFSFNVLSFSIKGDSSIDGFLGFLLEVLMAIFNSGIGFSIFSTLVFSILGVDSVAVEGSWI